MTIIKRIICIIYIYTKIQYIRVCDMPSLSITLHIVGLPATIVHAPVGPNILSCRALTRPMLMATSHSNEESLPPLHDLNHISTICSSVITPVYSPRVPPGLKPRDDYNDIHIHILYIYISLNISISINIYIHIFTACSKLYHFSLAISESLDEGSRNRRSHYFIPLQLSTIYLGIQFAGDRYTKRRLRSAWANERTERKEWLYHTVLHM